MREEKNERALEKCSAPAENMVECVCKRRNVFVLLVLAFFHEKWIFVCERDDIPPIYLYRM